MESLRQIDTKTILIFVPTEWARINKGKLYLNCFLRRQFILWTIAKFFTRYIGDREYQLLRRFKNQWIFKQFEKVSGYEILRLFDYIYRSKWFEHSYELFDGILSYSGGVVEPYSEISGKPGFVIEPLMSAIDVEFLCKRYPPSMYCSGRITSYRTKILNNLTDASINSVGSTIHGINFLYMNSDTERPVGYDVELYIPQHKWWPHSSPLRTFRSLKNGVLPVHFGSFDDITTDKAVPEVSQLDLIKSSKVWRDWLINFNIKVDKANKSNLVALDRFKKFLFEQ